jgi:hypothetical protein
MLMSWCVSPIAKGSTTYFRRAGSLFREALSECNGLLTFAVRKYVAQGRFNYETCSHGL